MTAKKHLERLGKYVASRRVALGLKHRIDLASSVNFSDRVLADIENGVRPVSAGSYAMLENALQWKPGSVDAILAGREPTEIHSDDTSLEHASTDELVELRRRVEEVLRKRLEPPWNGEERRIVPRQDRPGL